MSTFFRGITEAVPSLFLGIFSEQDSVVNPSMDVQGASLSTANSMDMQGVSSSIISSVDMQDVSISTASSMGVQGVCHRGR
jgi:hypothetical protein